MRPGDRVHFGGVLNLLTVWLIIVIALGALSIAYGVVTAKDVLSRDPGNEPQGS